MRPAFSLIVFTSLSGLGFGLAAVMGAGLLPVPSLAWWVVQQGLAMGLIAVGIAASAFHLGHPERAWRALSQWRTSWLSREGVLAGATLALMAVWAADGLYHQVPRPWLGMVVAASALATVWTTAMIYASLETVARWRHPLTPCMFIAHAISGGLVLAAALDSLAHGLVGILALYAILALIVATGLEHLWSRLAGRDGSGSSPESATGLGGLGEVRMLAPPHTEENWLQHEMGFVVARKHALVLRVIGHMLSALFPAAALLMAPSSGPLLVAAAAIHLAGIMVLRWLFFAEARHTVTLYYGARH